MAENNSEVERIRNVYKLRDLNIPFEKYSFFNPAYLFMMQMVEREILAALKKRKGFLLRNLKILDVGCGDGANLLKFVLYGANPENMFGADVLPDRIARAQQIGPKFNLSIGDASKLKFENNFFDVVTQFTVFTSILDKTMKSGLAQEMLRVLKDDGIILWYDFCFDNPRNRDVKGIKKKEIKELFPDCPIEFTRITLAPPILRLLIPYSWIFCQIAERIKLFNTHCLVIIRKNGDLWT